MKITRINGASIAINFANIVSHESIQLDDIADKIHKELNASNKKQRINNERI